MTTPVLLAYGFAAMLMICSAAIDVRWKHDAESESESGKYWGLGFLCFLFALTGSFFS